MLTSFMGKDKVTEGLSVGNLAPDFCLSEGPDAGARKFLLSDYKGRYVLLTFWASYDASSRLMNATLNHTLQASSALAEDVAMVSVSFDEYASVFRETVRRDGIKGAACLVETAGEASDLFKDYHLNRGFSNYLLDDKGIIVAKNLDATQLKKMMQKK